MAEKTTKKTVTIKRERLRSTKVIWASKFRLRNDKPLGLIDVYFESRGHANERVVLDSGVMQSNLDMLKKYAASLMGEQDDSSQIEDIAGAEQSIFANIVNFSRMGDRAETCFGSFSISDWVDASRKVDTSITSFDKLVAMSTIGLQKKLLLEMILLMGQI